jgi:uncharacterized protein YjbJ (UPF0337 family)
MTQRNTADEARKGLIDAVKGKAKEIVGAVTGNDSLTAEGQLDQAQAQERREANTVQAVADAEGTQAHAEAADARMAGAQERMAVGTQTATVESSIQRQQEVQKRVAEQTGERAAANARTQAEFEADRDVARAKAAEREAIGEAADEVVDANAEHQSSVQVAATEQAEADRIRREAAKLTHEADLP